MLLGLLSSYLNKQNKKNPHPQRAHGGGEEGRLGKNCPKCISTGRLCLIVLFHGLFKRTLFISRVIVSCSRQGSGLPPSEAQEFLAKSVRVWVFFPCVCYPDMFPPADRSCTWSCSGPLVPMRLLICLSPGIRACHSVSHLGHAVSLWGRLYLTWAKDLGAQGTFFQEQPCCGQPHHLQAPR